MSGDHRWFRRPPAGAGVLALLLIAAVAPLLANDLPLAGRFDGAWRFPALRCLGGEDRFWIALFGVVVAMPVVVRRRRRTARTVAVACIALALGGGGGRPLPGELDWRTLPATRAAAILPTPIGFGPLTPDEVAIDGHVLPAPPSSRHWLGTDGSARDLAARLLHGTRVSLGIALTASAVALGIGLAAGLACGAWRGVVDLVVMRGIEVFLCFPQMFLVLVVFAFLPHGRLTLALLLGAVGWTTTARIARGEFLRLQGEDFVLAARALGVPPWRIAVRHLLPNALGPVVVAATFGVAGALLAEFVLGFLGFGVVPPTPSLGQMLAEGRAVLATAPWIAILPGTLIFLVVLGFNALGEALRRRFDGDGRAPAAAVRTAWTP